MGRSLLCYKIETHMRNYVPHVRLGIKLIFDQPLVVSCVIDCDLSLYTVKIIGISVKNTPTSRHLLGLQRRQQSPLHVDVIESTVVINRSKCH